MFFWPRFKTNFTFSFSFVDGNGEQFKIENYSLDFFCPICKSGYMIDGNYKISNCPYHINVDKTFFESNSKEASQREINANTIRNKMLYLGKGIIKEIFLIRECCITNCHSIKDFEIFFKHIQLKKNLFTIFDRFSTEFEMEKFKEIDPQNCILPQLISPIKLAAVDNLNAGEIRKYDIEAAYISCLKDKNFVIPYGPPKFLVGYEAEKCFQENILCGKKYFSICKISVFIDNKNPNQMILPFFQISVDTNKVNYLSSCYSCSLENSINPCLHTQRKRSFIVTCLSEDVIYCMNVLCYNIKILSLIYFEEKQFNKNLNLIANELCQYKKKSTCVAEKFTIKQIILRGLGRFAFNPNKNFEYKKYIYSGTELECLLEKNLIKSFQICNSLCIANIENKNFIYEEIFKKSVKSNISLLLFASISNQIRRIIYETSLQILNSKLICLLRIDVDSILLHMKHHEDSKQEVETIFNKRQDIYFKLEETNITHYMSLKHRSYAYVSNQKSILKTPGLQLSYQNRENLDIRKIVMKKFNQVIFYKLIFMHI